MALTRPSSNTQASLDAQLDLWHHTLGYIKSMALKSALDLRIADAIHSNGGTATLSQIATNNTLHPSKIPYLWRLMRVLTVTDVLRVVEHPADGGESSCPRSTALASGSSTSFKMENGHNAWDLAGLERNLPRSSTTGWSRTAASTWTSLSRECDDVFQSISSLMDVADGLGGASQAISKAFPRVKCSVLDLPHVVAAAPTGTNVEYIVGGMFQSIPPTSVVFLKADTTLDMKLFLHRCLFWLQWVLHD
ncbi:hypothetical protein PR202_ga05660 [Eleusine coracana subsp. coracana]|uniref:Uncharacterized protein n=1 Tax=Eleusine coracana subsp. coracana TaxID=191504 RepID=A0AAV5BUX5_ELECO|nr:hypothetical protein PR202_ga05206 [Eleusine coracana subsp. coracana]GJM89465.1 hypothetical protein PR202_ga05660 [Eleusine coracana subsp. coracana]